MAWAVALTADTPLAPQRYERRLLARYQRGELTIDQVIELLDASVYQILYRSRATSPLSEAQLLELLDQARCYNAGHDLTGLLLYSDGRFVQALEGPEAEVRALYARIQRDSRHRQVVTVSEGPGPHRRFAGWSMAFGQVPGPAVERVLGAVQAQEPLPGPHLEDPHLQALLEAFGVVEATAGEAW